MPLFEPVLGALTDAGVRYVVVGGVAVVLHGHARLTADLDLVIDLADDQARAPCHGALALVNRREPRLLAAVPSAAADRIPLSRSGSTGRPGGRRR